MKKLLIILLLFCRAVAGAQGLSERQIDSLSELTMKAFDVPGIAVAIIKDGRVIHSKGYGVRSLNTKLPVDENTLFGIASNTKAFTAAAIGILVDEGKLAWDDKVIHYIPEFKMYDPYVSQHMTIRDLLAHRSGLGQCEGDLMLFPAPNDFTTKDIIHSLQFLEPAFDFRTKFCYSNVLYAVAGEIVTRVSGKSYSDFVEQRIMRPLGMLRSRAYYENIPDKSNVIEGHDNINGVITVVPRNTLKAALPAGGVYASLADMEKWVLMQLNDGTPMLSAATHREMWTPQTILPVTGPGPYQTRLAAYGLGFEIYDIKGNNRQIRHSGEIDGMMSQITMIQELNLGIIILTNQEEAGAFITIANTIKDSYLDIKGKDRLAENLQNRPTAATAAPGVSFIANKISNPGNYTGTYRDNWLGEVTITYIHDRLRISFKRSPKLAGELYYNNKGNTFIAWWDDRTINADAYVNFTFDKNGKAVRFTMSPVSPDADPSYDYQDLHFHREQ